MAEVSAPVAPSAPQAGQPSVGDTKSPPADLSPVEKKIWKLKADGEEFEFDASDEDAVKREIMKARGSNKRFEQAAAMRREAEGFLNLLKTDPRAVLENPKLGVNFRQFAEKYLWEQMQEEALSPEQRQAKEWEKKAKAYEEHQKKEAAQREAQETQMRQAHWERQYESTIVGALEAGGLPKSRETVRRMATYLQQAVAQGIEIDARQLAGLVKRDYINEHKALYGQADADTLIGLVGEDLAKKIRQSDLKRLKSTQGSQFHTPEPRPSSSKDKPKPKKLSGTDWRAEIMRETGVGKRR